MTLDDSAVPSEKLSTSGQAILVKPLPGCTT